MRGRITKYMISMRRIQGDIREPVEPRLGTIQMLSLNGLDPIEVILLDREIATAAYQDQ